MDGITFLASAGIAALLRARARAEVAGHRLALSRLRPNVRRVLQITGVLDLWVLSAAPASGETRLLSPPTS